MFELFYQTDYDESQESLYKTRLVPWAVGDCCVSLKMLKSPHKEICSFKLTMLWLSLSSSLSLSPCCIDSALCLDMGFWERSPKAKTRMVEIFGQRQ